MDTRSLDLPVVLPAGNERLRSIGRLQEGLTQIKGVEDAAINNAHDFIHLAYDPNRVTLTRLQNEAARMGAQIRVHVARATFALETLDSPDSARSIERALGSLEGVLWAGANFPAGQVHVEYLPDRVLLETIRRQLAPYQPTLLQEARAHWQSDADEPAPVLPAPSPARPLHPLLSLLTQGPILTAVAVAFTLWGGLASWLEMARGSATSHISMACYAAAIVAGGIRPLFSGLRAARRRAVDINTLVVLAVIGAAAGGEWADGAITLVLYNLGVLAQSKALARARQTLQSLKSLAPSTARILRNKIESSLPLDQAEVGDTLVIRPGERIALDAEVISGASAVNEAPITGESRPVEKTVGAHLYAGTLNGSGTLEARVTRRVENAALQRLLNSLQEALAQRAPAELQIEHFVRVYTPVVFWLAIGIAIVPPLLAAGDFAWSFPTWLHRALCLLIVACPWALLLSTPVVFVTALGTAARRGVVVKGSAYLEAAGALKAVAYGKTGALTAGAMRVEDIVPIGGTTCAEIAAIASALEGDSTHPIALAIRRESARHLTRGVYAVSERVEMPGKGVRGSVNGVVHLLGSPRLFQSQKMALPPEAEVALTEAEASGMTVVLLGNASGPLGLLLLRDAPRPEVQKAIGDLRRRGIVYQGMLTGDSAQVAANVAAAAGLEEYEGGLLPDQKLQHLRYLQRRYGQVAMVGDSATDAPVLSASNVGIAMDAAENEIALEAADVALLRDDLTGLPFLIHLSRSARAIVRQNVAVSLLVKAALLVAVLTATLPLWLVLLADLFVAMLVTLNATRLITGPDVDAAPLPEDGEEIAEPLLELVFINDKSVDEQPDNDYVYPVWERFSVPFTGRSVRFGRKSPTSTLPIQIDDSGMSRLHGEVRMEGGRPVVVDLYSTNGIRYNGRTAGALIPPERPTPLRFGDNLMIGRNTRIEIRPPGEFGTGAPAASGAARAVHSVAPNLNGGATSGSGTQDLRGKYRTPTG